MSMNGQSSGRSRLEEAQKKQQETIDQGKARFLFKILNIFVALAQRLHRQEVAMRERAARERARYQQSSSTSSRDSNCTIS